MKSENYVRLRHTLDGSRNGRFLLTLEPGSKTLVDGGSSVQVLRQLRALNLQAPAVMAGSACWARSYEIIWCTGKRQGFAPKPEPALPAQKYGSARDVRLVYGIKPGTLYNLFHQGKVRGFVLPSTSQSRGLRLFDFGSIEQYIQTCRADAPKLNPRLGNQRGAA